MIRTFLMRYLCYHFLLTIIYADTSSSQQSNGLKWVRVNLPRFSKPGEQIQLHCDYDLGNDTLYAVKWYKDNEEFYRFVPRERPQTTSHKVDGVHVNMSESNSKTVVLDSINLRTSGLFRCEVSAEAPSFASAQSEAKMEVVVLSTKNPTISGVPLHYKIGDEFNLNCTSGESHPVSLLHWFINDHQVTSDELVTHYPLIKHHNGLLTSVLGLHFVFNRRNFPNGSLRLKCVASITPILWTGDSKTVVQSLPIQDRREAQLLVKNNGSKNLFNSSIKVLLFLIYFVT